MAKFCTKCGKPLVEGQTCNCGNEERPEVETMNFSQPSANDFQQACADYFRDMLNFCRFRDKIIKNEKNLELIEG